MLAQPIMFPCVLSSGSTWSMPSILPAPGDSWPTGGSASAYAVFTDTAGDTLATVDGMISANSVDFVGISHAITDAIPAGSNCEIFITDTEGNPYKIRYGRVVRREVTFPDAPANVTSYSPLAFSDNMQRTAIGNNWVVITGSAELYVNTDAPYSLGATQQLLSNGTAALRWYQPLATDSWQIDITTWAVDSLIGSHLLVVGSADINLTTGLVAHFTSVEDTVQLGSLAGPLTATGQSAVVANTIASYDTYTLVFDDTTATLSVYKNGSDTALTSWTDTLGVVAHGPGYRYLALAWDNGPLTDGTQVSSWQAQDSTAS